MFFSLLDESSISTASRDAISTDSGEEKENTSRQLKSKKSVDSSSSSHIYSSSPTNQGTLSKNLVSELLDPDVDLCAPNNAERVVKLLL